MKRSVVNATVNLEEEIEEDDKFVRHFLFSFDKLNNSSSLEENKNQRISFLVVSQKVQLTRRITNWKPSLNKRSFDKCRYYETDKDEDCPSKSNLDKVNNRYQKSTRQLNTNYNSNVYERKKFEQISFCRSSYLSLLRIKT